MRLESALLRMSDELDSLLDQARRVGEVDSQGAFMVELGRARGDLGKNFALAYPGHYGLKFVQAAVALGAKDIEVFSASDRLHISFDCPPDAELLVSEEGLLKVTDRVSSAAAVSLLLQAIWGSLFDDALKVQLDLQLQEESQRITFDLEGVKTESYSRADAGEDSLEILVHRQRRNRKSELALFRERCGYCPVPLKMNNLRLDGTAWKRERCPAEKNQFKRYAPTGFRLAERYLAGEAESVSLTVGLPGAETRGFLRKGLDFSAESAEWRPQSDNVFHYLSPLSDGPYDGAVALPVELAGPCKLVPVEFGVSLEPMLFRDKAGQGALAVINCARYGLQTDLYGFRVVDNQALESAQTALSEEFRTLADVVCRSINDLEARKRMRWTSKHQMSFGATLTGLAIAGGLPFITIAAGGVQMLNALMMKSGPDQEAEDTKNFREAVYRALKGTTF